MKSSITLLIVAGLGVTIQLACSVAEYGSCDIATEITIIVCASHICRSIEDKLC
jgi:hypothetical protein